MKNVITPGVKEEVEYVCDSCKAEAFTQLTIHSWYGSEYDMTQASIHFCDKCAKKAKTVLEGNFNIKINMLEITEL